MALDYRQAAQEVLDAIGGPGNVVSAAHCATRRPVSLPPVKKTTSYFWRKRSAFSFLSPSATDTYSGGKASFRMVPMIFAVSAAEALGFTSAQFPAAMQSTSGTIVS